MNWSRIALLGLALIAVLGLGLLIIRKINAPTHKPADVAIPNEMQKIAQLMLSQPELEKIMVQVPKSPTPAQLLAVIGQTAYASDPKEASTVLLKDWEAVKKAGKDGWVLDEKATFEPREIVLISESSPAAHTLIYGIVIQKADEFNYPGGYIVQVNRAATITTPMGGGTSTKSGWSYTKPFAMLKKTK